MTATQDALEPALGRQAAHGVGFTDARARLLVYPVCTALMLISNYLLGRDMLWDTLDYHFYAGFSALNDRFGQDYFAAGPQSYLNPYAYVPFYLLVKAGLPALLISSVLAIVQSTVLWLTYELALLACPAADPMTRATWGGCAVALAFLNPVLIQQAGSSFDDATTAIPALGALVLLVSALRAPAAARVLAAGLLFGVATALKLTNSLHAIVGTVVLIVMPLTLRERIRYLIGYAAAGAIAFAIVTAPWSLQLERHFGNPLFPLMNSVFRSPEFTTEPLLHYRFIPASLPEALWRPFAMIDRAPMVHQEYGAPDLRYAILVLLAGAVCLGWLWRRVRQVADSPRTAPNASPRVPAALAGVLAIDWALWLASSGNSRYFLPISSVAAVVLVTLVHQLWGDRRKATGYLLGAIVAAQLVAVGMGPDYRWSPKPWGGSWFEVEVPSKLTSEPNLLLTMGAQSNSFFAPFLASGAGLINFTGGYPLGSQGATGAHIAAMIHRFWPHVRVLVRGEGLYERGEGRPPQRTAVDDAVGRFGLRVDPDDCVTLRAHGLPPDLESIMFLGAKPTAREPPDTTSFVSCRLITDPGDHAALAASRAAADLVLDRVEDACPKLFQPRRTVTEHGGSRWQRLYVATDLSIWISHGEVTLLDSLRGDDPIDLGRAADWARAPLSLACGRRNGHYFARLLPSKAAP